MSLFETLKAVNDRGRAETNPEDRAEILDDWRIAINELYNNIISWVDPYIRRELITAYRENVEVSEEPFGSYDVAVLRLKAGTQYVVLFPVGRLTTASAGRVDMWREGSASSNEKYRIIRKIDEKREYWQILAPTKGGILSGRIRQEAEDLVQFRFEDALEQLLLSK